MTPLAAIRSQVAHAHFLLPHYKGLGKQLPSRQLIIAALSSLTALALCSLRRFLIKSTIKNQIESNLLLAFHIAPTNERVLLTARHALTAALATCQRFTISSGYLHGQSQVSLSHFEHAIATARSLIDRSLLSTHRLPFDHASYVAHLRFCLMYPDDPTLPTLTHTLYLSRFRIFDRLHAIVLALCFGFIPPVLFKLAYHYLTMEM